MQQNSCEKKLKAQQVTKAGDIEVDPIFVQLVAEFIDQYRPALEALTK
jgi:hypothetical protein